MAQKFTVPITVKQLTSASSDAVTVYVDADTYARLKVEAGGRLVWGSGSATGDVTLYRESADILKTDDSFKVGGLFTVTASSGDEGGEINLAAPATNTAISGNVAIDIYQNKIRIFETGGSNRGAYIDLTSANTGVGSNLLTGSGGATTLDGLTDVTAPTPASGDFLKWNGTAWVNDPIDLGTDTTGNYVASLVAGTGVTLANNTGEGATPTISVNGDSIYTTQVKHTVKNDDSITLTKGTVVYTSGSNGTNILVKRAQANSEQASAQVLGFVESDIAVNAFGYVVTSGLVTNIDTNSATVAGEPVWLSPSTAGGVIYGVANKPYAPNHLVYLGVVTRKNVNTGEIFVHINNGWELDELHSVDLKTNAPASGDFLKYNGTVWVNDAIDLGTDTVGNYMSDVSAGTGISVTHTPSEGSTGTVAIDTAVVPQLGVTNTFSTNQIISGSTTADLLRITQTGTGNALVVEDSTNPDSTPFVVDASGNVLIGGTSTTGSSLLEIFNDGSLGQTIRGAGAAGGRLLLQRANGTMSSPTAVTAANVTGQIRSDGYDGTNYTNSSAINFSVDSTVSTGVVPGRIGFFTASSAGTLTERMRINSAGEVGIGVSPATSITLRVMKTITGAINAYGITSQGVIQSDVTSAGYAYYSGVGTAASASIGTVSHYAAVQGTFDATSAVTTQNGFQVSSGMTGATTNYGFRGALAASGTSRWNLNMDGTAPNYLAGRLGVGTAITSGAMAQITNTTAADKALVVKGAASQTGALFEAQDSAGTALAYITASGNYFTTSGGYYSTGGVVLRAGSTAHVYLDTASGTAAHGEFYFRSSSAFTERMRIDSSGQVGIGGIAAAGRTLAISKNITGSTVGIAAVSNGVIQSDVTAEANSFRSSVTTVASAFTLTLLNHFAAVPQAFGAGSAVTTQVGFNASSALTGATNNYGFVGDIPSGTGRYNLWMAGTADNYILGNTGIGGLPTANIKLTIAGPTANSANPAVFINGVSGSGSLQLFNDLSAGAYNNITAAGSKGIIAAGANSTTSRASFVIAPWSDVTYGIRFEGGATTNILQHGTTIFRPSATTSIASIVRGLASQTANLQEWQNSSSTILAYVDSSGNAKFASIDGGSA